MAFRTGGIAITLAAFLAAGFAFAQETTPVPPQPDPPQIVILDQERMYRQSDFGKRVDTELKEQADALSVENLRIDEALTEEELRLTNERSTMAPEDFRVLAADFDERVTAIRRAQVAKQAAIQQLEERERIRFFELVGPVLFSMVRESGAVAILNRNAVVLPVRDIDITNEAIARINTVIGEAPPEPDPGQLPVPRPEEQP